MAIEEQRTAGEESNPKGPAVRTQTQFIEVSAALIFHAGRLLITQRHAHSHLGGCWEFPGGKREAGETFQECLVREIREELGIEISVGELFQEISHVYPEKAVHLKFFRCQILSGEPQLLDCAALKWIQPAELEAHEFPAADAQLIAKLKASNCVWQVASGSRA